MNKSLFKISKMDCPSEERLIRMALDGKADVRTLEFDLQARMLTAIHSSKPEDVLSILKPLNLGAELTRSEPMTESDVLEVQSPNDAEEMSVLKKVFAINAAMFFVGFIGGWIAQSTGLIADSLDMFADAAVFGLSMYAVGRSIVYKKRAAKISGYLQMLLAVFAFSEVIRRFVIGSEPEAPVMMSLALVALIANATCMYMLSSHRKGGVHMRASWIFLSNDVIANAGVIVAGILVAVLNSHVPDLVVGALIAIVVFTGSLRILKAAR